MIHKNKKMLTISAGCENQFLRGMKPGQEKTLVKRQGHEYSVINRGIFLKIRVRYIYFIIHPLRTLISSIFVISNNKDTPARKLSSMLYVAKSTKNILL